MSDITSSPTSIVAYGSQSATGGTCFLDLPPELRTMVYDLSIPRKQLWFYPLPSEPKAKVLGINLLRTCRQIREETSNRVWSNPLCINLPLSKQSDTNSIDLGSATSSLHDLALAKIPLLRLEVKVDPDDLSSCGLIDLGQLSSFKSLWFLHLVIRWGEHGESRITKPSQNPTKTAFIRGLVIQILLQVPPDVTVRWGLRFSGDYAIKFTKALQSIGDEYKSMQGVHYKPKSTQVARNVMFPQIPKTHRHD